MHESMRSFVVKRALRTVNTPEQPHTSFTSFPLQQESVDGVLNASCRHGSSTAPPWFKMNMRPNRAENPQRNAAPLHFLPARTGERIAGISCPRRGQQVPKGLGHFQIGRLRRPSGPHNQSVTVNTEVPDAPTGISSCSRMILADTFLILS